MPVYSLQFPLYRYDSGIPVSPCLIMSYKPLLFWMNSDSVYSLLKMELYISTLWHAILHPAQPRTLHKSTSYLGRIVVNNELIPA